MSLGRVRFSGSVFGEMLSLVSALYVSVENPLSFTITCLRVFLAFEGAISSECCYSCLRFSNGGFAFAVARIKGFFERWGAYSAKDFKEGFTIGEA